MTGTGDATAQFQIAAIVIWYNPVAGFVRNIETYAYHVEKTIIVDNSDTDNAALAQAIPNAEYIPLGENRGIAAALNVGMRRTAELGMDWALTMDQDSWFEGEDISRFLDPNPPHFGLPNAAIFCPNSEIRRKENIIVECVRTNTSGSLTSIAHFQAAGGFNEDMLIDEVDHEYCYRLKRAGGRILQLESVYMHHTLGAPVHKTIFGKLLSSFNHNPERKYYIARNRLYVGNRFPEFSPNPIQAVLQPALKILLVEDRKLRKIGNMAKGIFHYWTGRMGAEMTPRRRKRRAKGVEADCHFTLEVSYGPSQPATMTGPAT